MHTHTYKGKTISKEKASISSLKKLFMQEEATILDM